jgi:hypothetical protein
VNYWPGNNKIVEVFILIVQACVNLKQWFRRAPATPDAVDAPEQRGIELIYLTRY